MRLQAPDPADVERKGPRLLVGDQQADLRDARGIERGGVGPRPANHEAIAAAKAGIHGLVRSAAASYAARSIRVNAVVPGLVDTPLAERIVSR